MKKIKAILIGAGSRGITYTNVMAEMPDKFEIVAVAEPIESRREYIKKKHGVADDMCFDDWKPLLEMGKIADIAIIATMDRDHFAPAMKAIDLGYDLLLEKPIAPTPEECKAIKDKAEEKGTKVVICTVLRYTDLYITIKDIIDSGEIGKVMAIDHEECVGNVHQSHSFVRGNWGNEERSSNMLLQKSCHDMDLLQWLIGKKCKKVQSFGTLSYFTKENAPEGAPEYCVDGCPKADTCPYNAINIYNEDHDWLKWINMDCEKITNEMGRELISDRSSQYGKCVFKCDNNVVDHQSVNLMFDGGVTVTFTMCAFNKGGRFIHIMGTKGELRAALDEQTPITLYDFETEETKVIPIVGKDGISGGHGGGDRGIIEALYLYFNDSYTGKSVPDIGESYENHLIAFAAEESRKTNTVVDFDEYVKTIK